MATIDTTRTIEIRQSPLGMLKILGAGVALIATSLFLIAQNRTIEIIVGSIGIAFFGSLFLIGLWRLLTTIGPVVTVSPTGLRDRRVAADLIPWPSITAISTWSTYNQPAIIVAVQPAVEKRLRLSLITRMTRRANASLGADGLAIASQGLSMSHDELLDTIAAYWERYGSRRYTDPDQ